MSISGGLGKKAIILIVILVVIGGGAAAYFLYFKDIIGVPLQEPEKVAKRMKIEIPAPPPVEKKEAPSSISVQPQAPPSVPAQVPPAKQEIVKSVPVQPETAKKEEIKPIVEKKPITQEAAPEKKIAVKKEKPKTPAKKNAVYAEVKHKPWAVHIASYTSMGEAQTIVKKLKQDNYNAYVTEFNLKGRQWFRVRIGFYASEKDAKEVGRKISSSYNISGIWTVKPMKKEIMTHLDG